jgi:aspartate/methionine/tyrosine aminotransferase
MAAALALLADRDVSRDRELLDLSQAAPPYPPAPEVVARVVEVARAPDGAAYTPVPGIPPLRRAIADELSRDYAGSVEPADVVVTAGCNQAFSLVANALAGPGDEVITPLPYYFNHDMWLRMHGVRPVYLESDACLVPRAVDAEALVTPRTRAIVLITPGNPSGVTIPPAEIDAATSPWSSTRPTGRSGTRGFRPTRCSPTRPGARRWSACTRTRRSSPSPATGSGASSPRPS